MYLCSVAFVSINADDKFCICYLTYCCNCNVVLNQCMLNFRSCTCVSHTGSQSLREQYSLQPRRPLDRVGRRGRSAQAVGPHRRQAADRLPRARRRRHVGRVPPERVSAGVRQHRQVSDGAWMVAALFSRHIILSGVRVLCKWLAWSNCWLLSWLIVLVISTGLIAELWSSGISSRSSWSAQPTVNRCRSGEGERSPV